MSAGQIVGTLGAFLIPLIFIAFGWLFTHGRYPKHPNGIYGYRTTRSMKNDETWVFAQECWGRLSWRMGWWLLVSSLIVVTIFWTLSVRGYEIYVGVWNGIQAVVALGTILPVERALKYKFDEYGRRKMSPILVFLSVSLCLCV